MYANYYLTILKWMLLPTSRWHYFPGWHFQYIFLNFILFQIYCFAPFEVVVNFKIMNVTNTIYIYIYIYIYISHIHTGWGSQKFCNVYVHANMWHVCHDVVQAIEAHLASIKQARHLTVQWGLSPSWPQQKHQELLNFASHYINIAKLLTHPSISIIHLYPLLIIIVTMFCL